MIGFFVFRHIFLFLKIYQQHFKLTVYISQIFKLPVTKEYTCYGAETFVEIYGYLLTQQLAISGRSNPWFIYHFTGTGDENIG